MSTNMEIRSWKSDDDCTSTLARNREWWKTGLNVQSDGWPIVVTIARKIARRRI
jgi:hypothetical protein